MDSDIQTICRSLLTEYLVHNCYKNTAKAFLGEVKKLNSCVDNGTTASNGNGVQHIGKLRLSLCMRVVVVSKTSFWLIADVMDIDHDTNGNTASTTGTHAHAHPLEII